MKKATFKQLMKLKELSNDIESKDNSEKSAIFTSFFQILNDIDNTSQFKNDFQSKLIAFNSNNNPKELIKLMKQSIDYYEQD